MMVIDAVLTKSRSTVGGCSGTSCGGGAPAVWVLSGEFAGRPGDPAQAVSTLSAATPVTANAAKRRPNLRESWFIDEI